MDSFDSLSASEKAEATELQRMIAIEQQKAQFQAQVCMLAAKMLICYLWEPHSRRHVSLVATGGTAKKSHAAPKMIEKDRPLMSC